MVERWPRCAECLPSAEPWGLRFFPSVAGPWNPTREIGTPRASRLWTRTFWSFHVGGALTRVGNTRQCPSHPCSKNQLCLLGLTRRVLESVEWINFIQFLGIWKDRKIKGIIFQFFFFLSRKYIWYKIQKGLQLKISHPAHCLLILQLLSSASEATSLLGIFPG